MKSLEEFMINEAFDYKAENCDGACDRRSDYFKDCMKLLKEHIQKLRESQKKQHDENPEDFCKGGWDFTVIGIINPVLKMLIDSDNAWYIDNEILGILEDAINGADSDFKFHEGWEDVKELDKSIENYRKQIKKYKQQVQELHNNTKINYDVINGVVVGASNKIKK